MFVVLALILFLAAIPAQAASAVDPVFGKIDLAFERNDGQLNSKVKFLTRGQGYSLFLTDDEAVMRFTRPNSSVIRMKLLGRNRSARVEGVDRLNRTTNYLLGNGSAVRTNVPSYKKVRYSGVYPGIDVEYHGNGRLMEYDFVVQPGSDPSTIRLGFSGIRDTSIDSSGNLIFKTGGDSIVQKKPRAYQDINGHEREVDASYLIAGDHVSFKIGDYDKTRPLVIDPVLVYSSYFGGTEGDIAYGIAVDAQGAVYVAGVTASTAFPVAFPLQANNAGGSSDAFVFKFDPTGTQLVYSTFIGGSNTDEAHGIAVDGGGNAYITGYTQSNDFPIVNGFQKNRAGAQEAYVVRLNSTGTAIVYSTFLGGTADDRGFAIALDAGNNAYVTGTTASQNFPTTASAFQRTNAGGFADAFVSKVGPSGNLVYSTYVGAIGNDNPLGLAVDGSGSAYVTGWTTSINFPRVNAFQAKFGGQDQPIGTDDVFVFKLNPAGTALDYSTYVGGTGSDEATRIAVDAAGNAYVTGYTSSLDFPTAKPYQALLNGLCGLDAFVFKLAPDGKSLGFSTYFGGSDSSGNCPTSVSPESGTGIAVDQAGAVYISGYTTSFDLPTANAIQVSIAGDRDAFIAKFDAAGNILVFSTFLGGTGADSATSLAIDASDNVYVTGLTNSGDFNLLNALQSASNGGQEAFVAKMNVQDIVAASAFQVAPQGVSSVITKGTRTDPVFGYATAQTVQPGAQLAGLAIIDLRQNGALISEAGVPAPALSDSGRLFVDVTSAGRSVLSIANPHDEDVTVDFFYTDATGATTQFANTTVKAHQHFSRFVTDDPLLVFAPGTLNFTASQPVAATAFFTTTNESGEFLLSETPIVNSVAHSAQVGNKILTIPELADGGGWKSDIVLVNTSEDRMNGEVRFFDQGGASTFVGIGDGTTFTPAVEFDIPPRSFQKVSTAGNATKVNDTFFAGQAASIRTPGTGSFQQTGWGSVDTTEPDLRLSGLEMIEYRQLGITQSEAGIAAPALRTSGMFFAELTDKARTSLAIVNPNAEDASVDIVLTDGSGVAASPVTITVPAKGQFFSFLGDAPVSLPAGQARTVQFNSSLPVFATALRFFTNERSDFILSAIPISDAAATGASPVLLPLFVDGANWKTQVILVNNSDAQMSGEIRFFNQGSPTDTPQPVNVGTADAESSVFAYSISPRSFYRLQTNGLIPDMASGTAQIVPAEGFNAPAPTAMLSHFVVDEAATAASGTTTGNTIFETFIEARTPAMSLRFYAEAFGDFFAAKPKSTRTTIVIANPNASPTTVRLELTSFDGSPLGTSNPVEIPAGGQLAKYLEEFPGLTFPVPFRGVLRVSVVSGGGVVASSFRVMNNERADYLVTTTGPLVEDAGAAGHLIFPYMTDGTGYTTDFIFINPVGVQHTSGVLNYVAASGVPLAIDTLLPGSIQIVPFDGFNTPHAYVLLNHRDSGVLTYLTSVEGEQPRPTFRMYAESIGEFANGVAGATLSSVALANPSQAPVQVELELRSLDGSLLRTSRPVQVPPMGQVSLLLHQVPGFETLAAPYQGILRVVSKSPQGVTAAGFRGIYNERGNLLFTTTGPLVEDAGAPTGLVFPHIAEGGGYTTQFIVVSGATGQGNSGILQFFNQEGNPLNVTLSER